MTGKTTAPTYVYLLDHQGEISFNDVLGIGDKFYGVCHGDDLLHLFPMGKVIGPMSIPSEKDVLIKNAMVDMWVNFATVGYVLLTSFVDFRLYFKF